MLDINQIKVGTKIVIIRYFFDRYVGRVGIVKKIRLDLKCINLIWQDDPNDYHCTEDWHFSEIKLLNEDTNKICRNRK